MSEPTGRGGVKTLAIRLPDELHAQLVLIASLEGQSLTDTIRQAISELIERKRGNGDLAAQAAKALEEMEQETQARKAALQALLGLNGQQTGKQTPAEKPTPTRGRPRRNGPAS
jgi:predicted DNA-binding protein